MVITVSGPSSYYCSELATFSAWIETQGYRQMPTHSQYECERWQRSRSLIVVYYNGTILLQGADTTSPRVLLNAFAPDQSRLPF